MKNKINKQQCAIKAIKTLRERSKPRWNGANEIRKWRNAMNSTSNSQGNRQKSS